MTSGADGGAAEAGLSRRAAERVTAALLIAFAGATLWDSLGRGAGWASDGPQSGYFPGRVGAFMLVGACIAMWSSLKPGRDEVLVTYVQLRRVLQVFGPLVVYVALIQPLGIYLASGLFMAAMMVMLGPFRPWQIALTGVLTPLAFFVVFERWFAVPLPKGPIEAMLGY
ncbi:MAG: tripartite tricarboxylate transporter TctB family protein [Gemmatimonadaceae bacterium]|nr:tripartite tricarboxylate transporter TctB family protein [Acetobacteraceae bacterium]